MVPAVYVVVLCCLVCTVGRLDGISFFAMELSLFDAAVLILILDIGKEEKKFEKMSENLISSKTPLKRPKTSAKKQKGGNKTKESSKGRQTQLGKKDEVDLSMASIGHPEIFPLVFTTKTQEIFNCRVNEDVTEENCFRLIKKEDIVQDLKTRATISDFHPVKKVVLEYPGEELLVVFDAKFQYGQNFYLVASEEAKENLLKPPETAEEKEEKEEENREETLEVHPYVPPVHKPWVSLGSEKEVEEESVKDTVTKIKYMISRVRRKFGAPVTFTDKNVSHIKDSYVECMSYQDKTFSIKMLEKDVGIQMVPKVREASTQTKWTYPRNAATQYFPRQLSNEEKEESLSSEKLKEFLTSVHLRMEIALQQNEIMNAFFDDWKALAEDESSSGGKPDVYLKAYQSFTDLLYLKDRTISCVCWHPTIFGIIAVSARKRLSYEEQVNLSDESLLQQSVLLFWNFLDPVHPQLMLECPQDIYCFQFSPNDPNIIAGGCINGQVVLWDISQQEEKLQNTKSVADGIKMTAVNMVNVPVLKYIAVQLCPSLTQVQQCSTEPPLVRYCAVSSIEYSHKKPITDMHWLPDYFEDNRMRDTSENRAGICLQLVTCSPDCSILFWDIPATKCPEQMNEPSPENIKEEETFSKPPDVPDTFKHLDLCWKPLIKINLCESDTNTEYGPIRICLRELHYHYKTSEKVQSLNTLEALVKDSPYAKMSTPSSKNRKVLESIFTDFFVVTENGEIVYYDWQMEIGSDSAKPKYTIRTETINTLQRSPFFKDIVLTVGGRNFAIWKEGVTNGPILQASCSVGRNTAGHWSLTRPGVFFIGRDDGNIEIWDLLKKTYEPSHFQNISKSMITFIRPWTASSEQHFLAVSDDLGVLHVLEICQTLSHPSRNEHTEVLDYFEREVKYLKYCEHEFQEYQEFQAKTEIKCSWRHRERKQKQEMELQDNADYTVFLDLEKQILMDLGLVKRQEILSSSDA
ncbi:PREDICTED: WD repeat-containing protein 63 [Phaethon lepturus]|uniref:WD repeat-containing protein 63 n=1 Tax=Phaethon lepturus TaxID=97097 RepID=UPI0005308BEC|nr:PREDICTED: WD repeat-containing protein 63 [Phaethon lepturus]